MLRVLLPKKNVAKTVCPLAICAWRWKVGNIMFDSIGLVFSWLPSKVGSTKYMYALAIWLLPSKVGSTLRRLPATQYTSKFDISTMSCSLSFLYLFCSFCVYMCVCVLCARYARSCVHLFGLWAHVNVIAHRHSYSWLTPSGSDIY